MSTQVVIAFYFLISIAMIVFDLVFLQWQKVHSILQSRHVHRMTALLARTITENIDRVDEAHFHMLRRRLRSLSGMEAFDSAMQRFSNEVPDQAERYLKEISSVFEILLPSFSGRNPLRRAYFSAIISRWYRVRPASSMLIANLTANLNDKALYVRKNSFDALAHIGQPEDIARAIRLLDAASTRRAHRLISEALIAYPGDPNDLADELLADFTDRSPAMQVCIINFLRLARTSRMGGAPGPRDRYRYVLTLMRDEDADLEVRISCMRYFMTNTWAPALNALVGFTRTDSDATWEYAAVAATVLAGYPCNKAIRALKRCLHSTMYYVRYNAATSLYSLGLSPERDLADVLNGDDRYARDMIIYCWKIEDSKPRQTVPASASGEDKVALSASASGGDDS